METTAPALPTFLQPGTSGESSYLDMGLFESTVGKFINWWPAGFNTAGFNTYLTSMFQQMKANGIDNLEFAFSQLSDISDLLSGNTAGASSTDAFAGFINWMNSNNLGVTGQQVIQQIISTAHANGIQVSLSFGGADASIGDFNVTNGQTPQQAAANLAQFLKNMGFSSVDFDIETGSLTSPTQTPAQLAAFFQSLHSDLDGQVSMTLTVDAGLPNVFTPGNPNSYGYLAPLFFSNMPATGQPTSDFSSMFDGINLMTYGGTNSQGQTVYYLDPNDPTWGIDQWIQIVGNGDLIHIGFDTAIDYNDPNTSANQPPFFSPPAGLSPGAAAAEIYQALLKALPAGTQLGEPFFWVDQSNTPDPYGVGAGPTYTSQYVTPFEQEFYTALNAPDPAQTETSPHLEAPHHRHRHVEGL